MQFRWQDLGTPAEEQDGRTVTIAGYPVAAPGQRSADRFMLAAEPSCCPGCAPSHPNATVLVHARTQLNLRTGLLRLVGRLNRRPGDPRHHLMDAELSQPAGWASVTRRQALVAGPLICLASAPGRAADPQAVIAATTAIDLHSHAGGIASVRRMNSGQAFGPVAEPMRQGGMAATCLAIVSDGPCHHIALDGHIHPYRTPDPGELYAYGQHAFSRLHAMLAEQNLPIIRTNADLQAARAGHPAAIIAAEGADFLEGQPDRVDEAHDKWALRHLQLTHYRVNELGDTQTEPTVHGGLTDTGAEVIRRCNKLGIVVDVAHGTYDLVKRAASVTTRPLILSHTALTTRPRPFTRLITQDHARLIAGTGGVIGIWPPAAAFPTLDALARGMARMVDVVGIDHVGLGTDMRGLVGPSIFPDYDSMPGLTQALLAAGFTPADTGKILGGNYARVFQATLA
jgi:membrane dipeptidase